MPFHLSFMKRLRSSRSLAAQPSALAMSPAARQAQSSPWQVPMPTLVRRLRSTRVFTAPVAIAESTSAAGTSSHSQMRLLSLSFSRPSFAALEPSLPAAAFSTVVGTLQNFSAVSSTFFPASEPGSGVVRVSQALSTPSFRQTRSLAFSAISL